MGGREARRGALVLLALGLVCSGAAKAASIEELGRNAHIQELLRASSSGLFRDRIYESQRRSISQKRTTDRVDVLVVGVDFSDSLLVGRDNTMPEFAGWPAQTRRSDRIAGTDLPMFSAHDADFFDIQMRKVADYFHSVSFGRFTLDWDVHPTIVNVGAFANDFRTSMRWYGFDDSSSVRLVELSQRVIDAVDDDVDFSNYDTLVLIHAGAGQETDILGNSVEQIFSNYLDRRDFEDAAEASLIPEPRLVSDEIDIEHVLILPESESQDAVPAAGFYGFFGTRGVYCFELGLRIGLLNMGDFTPSGRPDSQGIGNFGLMGYGLFTGLGIVPSAPCAFNRQLMGWVDEVELRMPGDLRLGAMGPEGDAVSDSLLLRVPISDREYFLLEYRLQDPNGDLYFSFDDLNLNHLPDFYDSDSDFGDGTPTGPFDPQNDTWESTLGADWDWFMSENAVRSPDGCMRAGGSGMYIWHIDERIILDSILVGDTTLNSDRERRGVDVEEADGIQDLDSPRPSPFFLGWDGDAFRGEGNDEFGPDTEPDSDSADGTPTGIRIWQIQSVSTDTTRIDGFCAQIDYRKALHFRLDLQDIDPATPATSATRSFVGDVFAGEINVADLGGSPASSIPDGRAEIIHAAPTGEIYVWSGSLDEWTDGDADPLTEGVLAIGDAGGSPPHFVGAASVADLDASGSLEILAHSDDGLYAFRADGSEFADGDGDATSFGRVAAIAGSSPVGPPLPIGDQVFSLRRADADSSTVLWRVQVGAGTSQTESIALVEAPLSDGLTRLVVGGEELVAFAVGEPGDASLRIHAATAGMAERHRRDAESFLPSLAMTASAAPGDAARLWWIDAANAPQQWDLPSGARRRGQDDGSAPGALTVAPTSSAAGAAPLVVHGAGRRLHALDPNLRARSGFPYAIEARGDRSSGLSRAANPLLVDLDADGRTDLLWQDPTGRAHAVDLRGRAVAGYPFVAPAEPAAGSAVADLDGDDLFEWVLAGRYEELLGADPPNREASTRVRSSLQVVNLPASISDYAPWTQSRADAANSGWQPRSLGLATASSGGILDEGTLRVHPHPVTTGVLRVRVLLRSSAEASCALYNLEGELVARGPSRQLLGGGHYDELIDVARLANGFYICQVRAGGDSAQIPFTIAR